MQASSISKHNPARQLKPGENNDPDQQPNPETTSRDILGFRQHPNPDSLKFE